MMNKNLVTKMAELSGESNLAAYITFNVSGDECFESEYISDAEQVFNHPDSEVDDYDGETWTIENKSLHKVLFMSWGDGAVEPNGIEDLPAAEEYNGITFEPARSCDRVVFEKVVNDPTMVIEDLPSFPDGSENTANNKCIKIVSDYGYAIADYELSTKKASVFYAFPGVQDILGLSDFKPTYLIDRNYVPRFLMSYDSDNSAILEIVDDTVENGVMNSFLHNVKSIEEFPDHFVFHLVEDCKKDDAVVDKRTGLATRIDKNTRWASAMKRKNRYWCSTIKWELKGKPKYIASAALIAVAVDIIKHGGHTRLTYNGLEVNHMLPKKVLVDHSIYNVELTNSTFNSRHWSAYSKIKDDVEAMTGQLYKFTLSANSRIINDILHGDISLYKNVNNELKYIYVRVNGRIKDTLVFDPLYDSWVER